ncbi:MAG: Rieske (2Fe-2S) protein [Acidimicrobiaceae bacterium]|nr:Rieske (2Fe-2S) protein [Acidimicrobiaceae bacterium]MYE55860.1 Rieske (2Fe-2S) protein [Acidimicrobiaceae bacterium]
MRSVRSSMRWPAVRSTPCPPRTHDQRRRVGARGGSVMNERRTLARNQFESTVIDADTDRRIYETFRHFWHPVARSSDVDADPVRAELCDQQLVIVRLDGGVRAFNDLCAHRGTALSLGAVTAGGTRLRCAYHGWQYDGTGRCRLVPQAPDLADKLDISVRAYKAEERYGLIWVCLEDEPLAPIPDFPQFSAPDYY